MFLALREMRHSKPRFALIVVMIALISYLIFVLTALASGLAGSNRQAIDSWRAQAIVLSSEANGSLSQSSLSAQQVSNLDTGSRAARIGQLAVTADGPGRQKTSAQLLGIDPDEFVFHQLQVSAGEKRLQAHDAIVDTGLRDAGYRLGDAISVGGSGPKLTIVGFTERAKLSVAPVIYTTLATWRTLKSGAAPAAAQPGEALAASAVIFQNDAPTALPRGTARLTMDAFIGKLPGYRAQNLTFEFMIGFLFAITLVVIAIFLSILTMQKIPSFAVLKVQGILTRYLVQNTIGQAMLVTAAGVTVGGALTAITAVAVPSTVPMSFDLPLLAAAALLLLIMSVIGSLASVRTIVRIDPVAIVGGS
jgi:putative ABC transport system permease protein